MMRPQKLRRAPPRRIALPPTFIQRRADRQRLQRRATAPNQCRVYPFDELRRMLLDGIVAQLAQDLALREVADVDRAQFRQGGERGAADADSLVIPGEAGAEVGEVWAQAADVVDGFFPEFLVEAADAEGPRGVEAEIVAGLDTGFEDEGLQRGAMFGDEGGGAFEEGGVFEEKGEGLQATEGG